MMHNQQSTQQTNDTSMIPINQFLSIGSAPQQNAEQTVVITLTQNVSNFVEVT